MSNTDVRKLNGVLVMTPKRDLTGGQETDELIELIKQSDADGTACLVINLEKVKVMSSMGLDALIISQRKYLKRGAKVRLCNVKERHLQLLAILKLAQWFSIYDDEEKAIAGCADA
jgi:anti-anti-sigma factor